MTETCDRGHPRNGKTTYVTRGKMKCRLCRAIQRRNAARKMHTKELMQAFLCEGFGEEVSIELAEIVTRNFAVRRVGGTGQWQK